MSEAMPGDNVSLFCPGCRRRLQPQREQAGQRLECPNCHSPVDVPAWLFQAERLSLDSGQPVLQPSSLAQPDDLLPPAEPGTPPAAPAAVVEAYDVPPPEPRAAPMPRFYQRAVEAMEEREEEIAAQAPPPEHPFAEGVWGFPWRVENIPRLVMLAAGTALTLALLTLALQFAAQNDATSQVFALLLTMNTFLLGMFTASFGAACLLPILESTAAGGDEVEWPSPGLIERLWPLWIAGFPLSVALTLGWLVGLPLTWIVDWWGQAVMMLLGALLLYPVFQLSSLTAGSSLQILARPILASLRTCRATWLVFLGFSAALAAVVALMTLPLLALSPWLGIAVAGPVLAIALFVYARLLGRLGWVVSRAPAAGRKRKDSSSER
jgi:hypothetical protein